REGRGGSGPDRGGPGEDPSGARPYGRFDLDDRLGPRRAGFGQYTATPTHPQRPGPRVARERLADRRGREPVDREPPRAHRAGRRNRTPRQLIPRANSHSAADPG